MAAPIYDITIEQGATFRLQLVWKDGAGDPVDLTGYEARMQGRQRMGDADTVFAISSVDGDIVLSADGSIVATIEAAATAVIEARSGFYDLELSDGDDEVVRIVQGAFELSKEVTR